MPNFNDPQGTWIWVQNQIPGGVVGALIILAFVYVLRTRANADTTPPRKFARASRTFTAPESGVITSWSFRALIPAIPGAGGRPIYSRYPLSTVPLIRSTALTIWTQVVPFIPPMST